MLTSAIFRGLRSVFFKNSFSLYQKYIREFVFKKLLRHLFLFKNYSIFPRGRLWSPHPHPQGIIIFYLPPRVVLNRFVLFPFYQNLIYQHLSTSDFNNIQEWGEGGVRGKTSPYKFFPSNFYKGKVGLSFQKIFWILVFSLLTHWSQISRSYLVRVPNYWTWTKTTPQKKKVFLVKSL